MHDLQEDELTGARVLSYVASQLRSHMPPADLAVFIKNVPPILKRLCSDGSAAAAKASSRCFSGPQLLFVRQICKVLWTLLINLFLLSLFWKWLVNIGNIQFWLVSLHDIFAPLVKGTRLNCTRRWRLFVFMCNVSACIMQWHSLPYACH